MPDLFSPTHQEETPQEETQNVVAPSQNESQTTHFTPSSNESHFHALAAYCQNPSVFTYQGKDISGTIHFFLRKHVITNVPWILATIGLFIIPPLAQIVLNTSPNSPQLPGNFLLIFLSFYYLVVFMYAFLSFLTWFYNIIIVTNTEVVDIDYADIVYHDLAATNVNLIEDVQYIQSGFISGLFNFGDVYVQTAGGKENIEAVSVPNPSEIAKFILSYIGKGELGG